MLPPATQKKIIELRKAGYSWQQIRRELKITTGQVAGVLWRAGMCKKKEPEEKVKWLNTN
jgi:transcriptional regulator